MKLKRKRFKTFAAAERFALRFVVSGVATAGKWFVVLYDPRGVE